MKGRMRVGTGASSVLMIVIILTLTAFAVLSFVSARSDYRIAMQSLETNQKYYQAERTVQSLLSDIDAVLQTSSSDTKMRNILALDGSITQLSENTVTFSEPAGENREIVVILKIANQGRYQIMLYEFINTETWEIDNNMNLWQE